jgi:parvulin-like peptidyl-prolyl isomerase
MQTQRLLGRGLLVAALSGLGAARAQTPAPAEVPGRGSEIAARAGEETLSRGELERLLLQRHAFSPDGREILRHLVQTRMIDHLGEQAGVKVGQKEINALWDRLDRDARQNGLDGGMAEELKRTGMTAEEFRELLRLQILQQILTRRSLALGADAAVSGDQMALWIDSEIEERGLQVMVPPWADGVIAHCGEVGIEVAEFASLLALHLPENEVDEAAYHALLLRGIERRMPDLSPEARTAALERELGRRRAEVEGDAAFKGLSFDDLLGAQGMTLEGLRRDPALAIAALSDLWMERTYDEDGLRAAYEDERSLFEARHGEAARAHAIFLRGAKFRNKWNPRTFEEAEAELEAMKARLTDLPSFVEAARALSEDPRSKAAGGELGWVTRGGESAPPSLREAVFTRLGTGEALPEGGALVGPVRLENGAALLWLSERRSSPGWEDMRAQVRQELRRRFLADVLSAEEVRTFRDR